MRRDGDRVTDIRLAYIGGGSRGWAWKLMADLALEPRLSGTVSLYDTDTAAARRNRLIGAGLAGREDVSSVWAYETADSLEEALTGADFVILSILPGTFAEMAVDVHLPEEYGIYQSVGDTAGPGGLMRSLRTVPIYLEFGAAIARYAPDAWVINYTNPMAICLRALYEAYPQIKACGCCHEVFAVQKLLAGMLADRLGITGVGREEIRLNVLGVNHFTWIDEARWQGLDLLPVYREFATGYYETGFCPAEDWESSCFRSAHRVKFDLFRRYGLIAAAGDRHLAEFMPPWYLKDPETVRKWKFHLTPVAWRIDNRAKLEEQSRCLAEGTEAFPLENSGEEGVRLLKALLGLGELITNLNLPNRGQMRGVPFGAVVETNALISGGGIRPLLAGELPPAVNSLVMRHVLNQETILRAAVRKDEDLAFQALMNEPLMTLDPDPARELFQRMLEGTRSFLPGWKF